jgi:hypothetical protein
MVQPTNQSLYGFEAQTKNRRGDFDAQITKPDIPILRPKSENLNQQFYDQTGENRHYQF